MERCEEDGKRERERESDTVRKKLLFNRSDAQSDERYERKKEILTP